jgi:hypothetical protein
MVILDWERFNSLAPRSHQTLLCQCDRCNKQVYVKKGNLYRYHKDGICLFYKVNQEPIDFVPTYEYCNNCRPRKGTPRSSPETRHKISKKLTGVKIGRRQTDEGLKRLSEKRMGSKNPSWNPDREAVERRARAAKTAKNLIWNAIARTNFSATRQSSSLRISSHSSSRE